MDKVPKILRIANDVENICKLNAPYSFEMMQHTLRLTSAINECLADVCPNDKNKENLDIVLYEMEENKNLQRDDFCLVMKPFVHKYYNEQDPDNHFIFRLERYNVSESDLHKLDNPNLTTAQMVSMLKRIWRNSKKTFDNPPKTFNQFLMAIFAVGVASVLFHFGTATTPPTSISAATSTCPFSYQPNVLPDYEYVDETFKRLPYILWRSVRNNYIQHLQVDSYSQIIVLARSVLDNNARNENFDESILRRDLFNLFPNLEKNGFPLATISVEARQKVNQLFFDNSQLTAENKRYLEWWYWINLKIEIRRLGVDWIEEVSNWFETGETSIHSIMCEVFPISKDDAKNEQDRFEDVCYPRTNWSDDVSLDSTFRTVPKIMLPNIKRFFQPNEKKDEQIQFLARLIVNFERDATVSEIKGPLAVKWKYEMMKFLPQIASLPAIELFSSNIRNTMVLIDEDPKISTLYWKSFVYELVLRMYIFKQVTGRNEVEKIWKSNVLNLFHGQQTDLFLNSLLCEMFQANTNCNNGDVSCQLKSFFFQKPSLVTTESESDYWNGFHWQITASCPKQEPIFEEYAHLTYPLNAMANVFLLFEGRLKVNVNLPLDDQLKMIAHWMVTPDRGRILQDKWPEMWFEPNKPIEYYEKWRYVHSIPGAKDIHHKGKILSQGTRRDLLLHNRQLYIDFIDHKRKVDPKHRPIEDLYRVDFLIDLTLLLRKLDMEFKLEEVWTENTIRWFHKRPLSVPQLESLLCEAFPRVK